MGKVTSVEPQKRNTKRFNIFIDGEFAFGADEDLVVDQRLIPGKIFTTSDVEHLLFEAEVGKLMEKMYRLFNVRARSEKEIRDYLKNLSFKRKVKDQDQISDSAIESLVNKLRTKGLLNDELFAKAWVEARRNSKKKGKIALKMELYQKGIAKDLIEQILESTSTANETNLAEQALEKKLRVWKNLSSLEFKKKTYQFLLRRGFEYEIIQAIIEKYLKKG